MLIAGDIGGTKTNLALFDPDRGKYAYSHLATYPSQNYPNLKTIVQEFIQECKSSHALSEIEVACFAIAGPVVGGVCRATNLPWVVESAELSKTLKIPQVHLLNDLEANAYAIDILAPDSLLQIAPGHPKSSGNRAVISPGTGLGEAGLYFDGLKYCPFATEGGHTEFGPLNELQIDLCRFLIAKYGHASYERILSGPGLHNVYLFYKEVLNLPEPSWLADELKQTDPAKVITQYALNGKSEICVESLNLFVSILGAEASNCALKYMATGGIYLGGGIPPKILPKLEEPSFYQGFIDKGRFQSLLEEIPIHVILDDKASLKGAARFWVALQERLASRSLT